MFKPGTSGNPSGRPTGSTNNISTLIREQIEAILSSKFTAEQIEQDIATLEPKDRLTIFLKLLEYSIPKMRSTELKTDNNQEFIVVIGPERQNGLSKPVKIKSEERLKD